MSAILDARAEFPALANWAYLNVASRCPLPTFAADALAGYLIECQLNGGDKSAWLDQVERFRGSVARAIGAQTDEVAFTKNVTEGLNVVAHGLRPQPGENIVLVPSLEHPTFVYAFLHLREGDVELRFVDAPGGRYDVDAIAAQIDERTTLVAISAISFLTGARADLARIAQTCRKYGATLLVDAAQALGVVEVDVERWGVDALAGSTQKGLLSVYGLGFLYCKRELAERITPIFLSRAGVDLPGEREFVMGRVNGYALAPGARRFEIGNYNYAAIRATQRSLDFLASIGFDTVERYVLALAGELGTRLRELGVEVVTPDDDKARAGIVSARLPRPERFVMRLERAGVIAAARQDLVRFSFHLYNNADDVERVLECAAGWR